jgi:hypothetical protein
MPGPVANSPESLLAPSLIRLFGRLFAGLQLHHAESLAGEPATSFGSGKEAGSLGERLTEQDPKLARIYGFSYEGNYYKLPKPFIFLVHGDGKTIDEVNGLAGYGFEIKEAALFPDVRVWTYDKLDQSIRIESFPACWNRSCSNRRQPRRPT